MASTESEDLTYRERSVDDELSEHEDRISRLEKAFLVGVGYVFAEQGVVVETFLSFVL
mgnify:CR=1 FL=1